eukprot:6478-Pyramimonas_sp.AAC.1
MPGAADREIPGISKDQPDKKITIQPNFDPKRFKEQLQECASEQARLVLLLGFHLKFRHASPVEMAQRLQHLGPDGEISK